MKALSIRQPWAWLILFGGKDIENRDWVTNFRGRFLIHAAKGMEAHEYNSARDFLMDLIPVTLPRPEDLPRGGVVGIADLTDCVTASKSPYFFGKYGFKLENAKPLPLTPWRGMPGFFDIPMERLAA